MLIGTWYLSKELKVILKLYFSFDKVLLTTVALSIGQVGFYLSYMPLTEYPAIYYAQCFFYPLCLFCQSGYYRVVLTHVSWTQCETIIVKIMLLLGGTSCFTLGLYYTISGAQFTNGRDDVL